MLEKSKVEPDLMYITKEFAQKIFKKPSLWDEVERVYIIRCNYCNNQIGISSNGFPRKKLYCNELCYLEYCKQGDPITS